MHSRGRSRLTAHPVRFKREYNGQLGRAGSMSIFAWFGGHREAAEAKRRTTRSVVDSCDD